MFKWIKKLFKRNNKKPPYYDNEMLEKAKEKLMFNTLNEVKDITETCKKGAFRYRYKGIL